MFFITAYPLCNALSDSFHQSSNFGIQSFIPINSIIQNPNLDKNNRKITSQ